MLQRKILQIIHCLLTLKFFRIKFSQSLKLVSLKKRKLFYKNCSQSITQVVNLKIKFLKNILKVSLFNYIKNLKKKK